MAKHKKQKYPQNNQHQHKLRSCEAKFKYPTKELALDMGKNRTKQCFAYECEFCNNWHLTTSDPSMYKREGA